MKLTLLIFLALLFFTNQCICQSDDKNEHAKVDSLKSEPNSLSQTNSKIIEFSKSTTKVRVIETCSTTALCGTFAFGSSSVVCIESGKYKGDTLIIATLCTPTAYVIDRTYTLQVVESPRFSVSLCNNKFYSPDWDINLSKNRYLLFFAVLKSGFN